MKMNPYLQKTPSQLLQVIEDYPVAICPYLDGDNDNDDDDYDYNCDGNGAIS